MAPLTSKLELLRGDHPELVLSSNDPTKYYLAISVVFKDGDDAVDTLKLLQREIRALIEEFKPAFQGT